MNDDEPTVLTDLSGEVMAPSPTTPAAVAPGDLLARRYRLEGFIKRRGSALTFRALDEKLSRPVLVHVLSPVDPLSSTVLEQARRAATATDSRFLRVLDALGPEGNEPPLTVCEYAPGLSLEQVLATGPLTLLEAAWLVHELADALVPMHEQGLFHQCLNPDTIILTASGNVKIVGFLIEAALRHGPKPAWNEQERADVRDLGRILYACTTGRWPVDADQPQVPTWGLLPAPLAGTDWVSPRKLDPGVPEAVSVTCDQVLSHQPHTVAIVSAQGLSHALARYVGAADAAPDLEQRVRVQPPTVRPHVVVPPADPSTPEPGPEPASTSTPQEADPHPWHEDSTLQWSPESDWAAEPAHTSVHEAVPERAPSTGGNAGTPRPVITDHPSAPVVRRRRLVAGLVFLVVLSVVVGVGGWLLGTLHRSPADRAGSSSSQGSASPASVKIVGLTDFDPSADGGNGEENPDELHYATHGKANTAWHTLTYLGNPEFGGLKPGVGLVVDLGKAVPIHSVVLTLQGKPTSVELRVPKGTPTSPPTNSQSQWQVVAKHPNAGTSVTLTPSKATTSRWVLVYLTKVPEVSSGKYRGGVVNVQVLS